MIHVRKPVAALCFLLLSGVGAFAQQDVTLENVGQGPISIPRVEVKGSSLGREDLSRLFNPDLKPEEARDLAAKFKAQSVSIPLVEGKDDEARGAIRELSLTGVDGGRIAKFSVGSLELQIKDKDGVEAEFKGGKFEMDGVDLSFLLPSGGPDVTPRFQRAMWEGFSGVFAESGGKKRKKIGTVKASLGSLVAASNFETFEKPSRGEFELKNFMLEPEQGSKLATDLAAFGFSKLNLGAKAVASHDPAKRKLDIEDVSLGGEGLGSLQLKASLGNVDKGLWSQDQAQQMAALVLAEAVSFEINYADAGLFAKGVAYVAKMQKRSADDLRKEWSSIAGQLLPALLGGDPLALKLAGELQKFILEPKALKIVVTSKTGALPLAQLATIGNPAELLQKINIEAKAN